MANGNAGNQQSAAFWLTVAGVLGVLGGIVLGVTAGKVGKATVSPVALAVFAAGCLMVLGAFASLFWGLVLFVSDRVVAGRIQAPPTPPPATHLETPLHQKAAPVIEESTTVAETEPKPPRTSPDELRGITANDLIEIRKSNTAVAANVRLRPYIDKWLTVTGELDELEAYNLPDDKSLLAEISLDRVRQTRALFSEEWKTA